MNNPLLRKEYFNEPERNKLMNAPKMTREEAINLVTKSGFNADHPATFIKGLEALGLIQFEGEKKATLPIIELAANGDIINRLYDEGKYILNRYGVIRLEEWPEGLVLWVGSKIRWKSWEKYYQKGDAVTIEYGKMGGDISGRIK